MSSIEPKLNEANDFLIEGCYQQAKEAYFAILEEAPENWQALHGLGLVYVTEKQYEKALRYLNKAVKIEEASKEASLWMHLGNVAKILKQYPDAEEFYRAALERDPNYAEAYCGLGGIMQLKGELEKARQHYQKALSLDPYVLEAQYNLGRLLLLEGQLDDASQLFKAVLRTVPDHILSRFQLGLIAYQQEDWERAKTLFLEVLQVYPDDVDCLNNLGVVSLKLGDTQQAVSFFGQVLGIEPEHVEARENIAAAYMQHNRFDNAIIHYEELMRFMPEHYQGQFNLACAYMAIGELKKAKKHFEALLRVSPDNSDILANLGLIAQQMKDPEDAKRFYRQVLERRQDLPIIQHMYDALIGVDKSEAPVEYVRHLFDHYAFYYDKHLQETLHYTIPDKLQGLFRLQEFYFKRALEIGCGTGLSGEIIKPFCDYLVGVDISEKMVAEAEKKFIYDELRCDDMLDYLKEIDVPFDLVLAADVFNYVGALDKVFELVAAGLNTGGAFIFTFESTEKAAMKLIQTGRFTHQLSYVQSLLARMGLLEEAVEPTMLRLQAGQPVDGYLIVARKGNPPSDD